MAPVVERQRELAAGARPRLRGFPYIRVGVRHRVVTERNAPAVTVSSMASIGAPFEQATSCEDGDPGAKISSKL